LVLGSGFWVLGSGFWVLGSGFWVLGSGFWVKTLIQNSKFIIYNYFFTSIQYQIFLSLHSSLKKNDGFLKKG
jgi:hypothetical protein